MENKMKTLEEILYIVEKETEANPHRASFVSEDWCSIEGIKRQLENAPVDKVFPIFWMETVKAPEGAMCDGFSIVRQYFNNKKEMVPVEGK